MPRNRFDDRTLAHQLTGKRTSRRELLRKSLFLGVTAAATGGLLAGCGDLGQRLEERRTEREAAAGGEGQDGPDYPELGLTSINGVELAVWDSGGDGDPVVFIHGAMGHEKMAILTQPALTENFRLIHYNRRGWIDSPQPGEPITTEQQAADCRAVMGYFGVERAHVEALSAGGPIALQLALDFPDAVHSLALLEPAMPHLNEAPQFLEWFAGGVIHNFQEGDSETAIDIFVDNVVHEEYFDTFDLNMPDDWFERWAEDLETLFLYDSPGGEGWSFTDEHAANVTQPVLNAVGADSAPYWHEIYDQMASLIPHAENVVIPDTAHAMNGINPETVALQLAAFFARHPIND